jgi:hypothetical protein
MHMHNYANHPAERLRNRVAHGRIEKYSRPKVAQRVVPPSRSNTICTRWRLRDFAPQRRFQFSDLLLSALDHPFPPNQMAKRITSQASGLGSQLP